MANKIISITIPEADVARVEDGFVYQHGYTDEVQEIDENGDPQMVSNPQTKEDFMKEKIKGFVKESVTAYEATIAANAAKDTAEIAAESEIDIQD